jgi:membrane protease YdiL (CAAX protease family)
VKLHPTGPLGMLVPLALLMMAVAMMRAWAWAIRRLAERRPLLPPAKLRDVPWGVGSVALVLLAWIVVNFGVANGYIVLADRGAPKAQPFSFTEQMVLVSLINAAVLVIVPALLRATSGARPADLGLRGDGLVAQARVGATAFLLMSPVVYALNGAASWVWRPHKHPLEEMVRTDLTPGIVDLAILSAVVLAPAAEELIFRGVIQAWLTRALRPLAQQTPPPDGPDLLDLQPDLPEALPAPPDASTLPAPPRGPLLNPALADVLPIVLTSAFFAGAHAAQWPAPLAIFLLSLGLGVVYQRTGSLVASFVTHALFNGLGTMLLLWTMSLGVEIGKKPNAPLGYASTPAPPPRPATSAPAEGDLRPGRETSIQDFFELPARIGPDKVP